MPTEPNPPQNQPPNLFQNKSPRHTFFHHIIDNVRSGIIFCAKPNTNSRIQTEMASGDFHPLDLLVVIAIIAINHWLTAPACSGQGKKREPTGPSALVTSKQVAGFPRWGNTMTASALAGLTRPTRSFTTLTVAVDFCQCLFTLLGFKSKLVTPALLICPSDRQTEQNCDGLGKKYQRWGFSTHYSKELRQFFVVGLDSNYAQGTNMLTLDRTQRLPHKPGGTVGVPCHC